MNTKKKMTLVRECGKLNKKYKYIKFNIKDVEKYMEAKKWVKQLNTLKSEMLKAQSGKI
jgi:hypothetical protein